MSERLRSRVEVAEIATVEYRREAQISRDLADAVGRLGDMESIGTSDLFAAGTGFDITGAVLLALGLLASPRLLLARGQAAIGFNSEAIVEACRDRARGIVGVIALSAGFVLQLVGYLASLENEPRGSGRTAVLVALLLAAAGVGMTLMAARLYVGRAVRRLLVSVALVYNREGRADAEFLVHAARHLGKEARGGESLAAFLRRVFPLDEVPLTDPEPNVLRRLGLPDP